MGQPQVPGSSRTLPCTHLSLEPLPPGHPLLDASPSPAFIEPLCHAGLTHMPPALSCESLMQILRALFTHWSVGVLPAPLHNSRLPWFPLALRPAPGVSLNHWPYTHIAGDSHPDISTTPEVAFYNSLQSATTTRILANPAISRRAPFRTLYDPVGSVTEYSGQAPSANPSTPPPTTPKHHPLLYPTIPPTEEPWSDTGSPPMPPSRRLLIRLLVSRCRVLQFRKVASLNAFRISARRFARDLTPGSHHTPPNPTPHQYDYAIDIAIYDFVRSVLHHLRQNRHFQLQAARSAATNTFRSALTHTFYRRVPRYQTVPRSWSDTPATGRSLNAAIRQATAITHHILVASNHLSFLIASLAHAEHPELGRVNPQGMAYAGRFIHTDPHMNYSLVLAPYSFAMTPFSPPAPGYGGELRYYAQHIGPIVGDDRGAYLADVRRLAGLDPIPPFAYQLPTAHE